VLPRGTTARCGGTCTKKLAPNPRATQWTERTLKLLANMRKLSKSTLHVHQWRTDACRRTVSRDPRTKNHKIQEISFKWPDPCNNKNNNVLLRYYPGELVPEETFTHPPSSSSSSATIRSIQSVQIIIIIIVYYAIRQPHQTHTMLYRVQNIKAHTR